MFDTPMTTQDLFGVLTAFAIPVIAIQLAMIVKNVIARYKG